MPISKWTKKALLDEIDEVIDVDSVIDGLEKMTKSELMERFLVRSSWHHTGAFYQATDFYKIDRDKVEAASREMTEEEQAERQAKWDKSGYLE